MWTMVVDLLEDFLEAMGSVGYFFFGLLRSVTVVPAQFLMRLIRGGGDLAWNLFWITMMLRMAFRLVVFLAGLFLLYRGYQAFKPSIDSALGIQNAAPAQAPRP